jgi:hypothetical protein
MSIDARGRAVEAILAGLSEEQAARWKELTGEPFNGNVSFPGPPGPPRRK